MKQNFQTKPLAANSLDQLESVEILCDYVPFLIVLIPIEITGGFFSEKLVEQR